MKAFLVLALFLLHEIALALMSSSESAEETLKEQTIIRSLIQKENEITANGDRQQKAQPRSPQYPIEILKQLELNNMLPAITRDSKGSGPGPSSFVTLKVHNETYSKRRDRLFHVWLPAEIIDATSMNRTIVRFQQTLSRDYFGNFTSSQITLTLREDAQLSPTTYLQMYSHWENDALLHDSIQTLHLKQGRKFHTFDITEFIAVCLKNNLTEPNFINIGFHVYEIHGRGMTELDFTRIFDVQVDLPLIMYFYGGFRPTEIETSPTRKRRSIGGTISRTGRRPSTQCQRRSFTVKPEEVDWNNVVEPKVLDLGYCSGTCPFPLEDQYYNFTLHSFLLDRYRLHHGLRAPNDFPHSSCIPLTYKSVSVLETVGADQIEAGTIRHLSVDTCGCR